MMEELKKLDISPDNIEGVEQYTDLSIDEIITQALGGIDRKWVIPMNGRHGYIIKKTMKGPLRFGRPTTGYLYMYKLESISEVMSN